MKKEKSAAEIICFILIAVILFLGWQWHKSEENRLKLLDDMRAMEADYEEKIHDLNVEIEGLKEEADAE